MLKYLYIRYLYIVIYLDNIYKLCEFSHNLRQYHPIRRNYIIFIILNIHEIRYLLYLI